MQEQPPKPFKGSGSLSLAKDPMSLMGSVPFEGLFGGGIGFGGMLTMKDGGHVKSQSFLDRIRYALEALARTSIPPSGATAEIIKPISVMPKPTPSSTSSKKTKKYNNTWWNRFLEDWSQPFGGYNFDTGAQFEPGWDKYPYGSLTGRHLIPRKKDGGHVSKKSLMQPGDKWDNRSTTQAIGKFMLGNVGPQSNLLNALPKILKTKLQAQCGLCLESHLKR